MEVSRRTGVLFVFIAAVLYSIGGLCIKVIPWSGIAINGGRTAIALVVIGAFLAATKHPPRLNRWIFLGAVCVFGTNLLYAVANKLTTAANSIVLQFTAPMFIVVFSALFLKKRFSRADVLAVVLTMAGISLFFFDQLTPGHLAGNCVAIFAGMAFACYYMSLEGASESQRMSAILIAHGLTFLVGLPFTFVYPPELSAAPVACILVLGVVQLGIPYVLLGRASGACPPLACSLLGAVEPLLNPVWVFIFDGEAPGLWALIGGVVVVATITVWCVYGDLRGKKAGAA